MDQKNNIEFELQIDLNLAYVIISLWNSLYSFINFLKGFKPVGHTHIWQFFSWLY